MYVVLLCFLICLLFSISKTHTSGFIKKITHIDTCGIKSDVIECSKHAIRRNIFNKKSKTVPSEFIQKNHPTIIEFHNHFTKQLSNVLNTKVYPTPLVDPLSINILVYDEEGDHIDWHYDNNIYRGNLYAVLVSFTDQGECSFYSYLDDEYKVVNLKMNENDAIVFEGNKILHKVTPTCKNEHRIVLAMTYCTDNRLKPFMKPFRKIKSMFYF